MADKFTPGPLFVNKHPSLSDLAICAEPYGSGWHSSIAVCYDREGVNPISRGEAEANARLFAASHDMLKALRDERRVRLLGQEPSVHWESMREERRACYAATDAAIAKATGEPS